MSKLVTQDLNALRLLLNEDLYLLNEPHDRSAAAPESTPEIPADNAAPSAISAQAAFLPHISAEEPSPAPVASDQVIIPQEAIEQRTPAAVQTAPGAEPVTVPPVLPQINEEAVAKTFSYLGENNKYFLILLEDPTHTTLNPKHKEMILKMMAAKKLELRDLAILNLSHYPGTKFQELKDFFSPARIALFGINPQQIGITGINSNVAGSFKETRILASYSLGAMGDDVDKKKEFWNVMKNF